MQIKGNQIKNNEIIPTKFSDEFLIYKPNKTYNENDIVLWKNNFYGVKKGKTVPSGNSDTDYTYSPNNTEYWEKLNIFNIIFLNTIQELKNYEFIDNLIYVNENKVIYYYDENNNSEEDGLNIIKPNNLQGRWIRQNWFADRNKIKLKNTQLVINENDEILRLNSINTNTDNKCFIINDNTNNSIIFKGNGNIEINHNEYGLSQLVIRNNNNSYNYTGANIVLTNSDSLYQDSLFIGRYPSSFYDNIMKNSGAIMLNSGNRLNIGSYDTNTTITFLLKEDIYNNKILTEITWDVFTIYTDVCEINSETYINSDLYINNDLYVDNNLSVNNINADNITSYNDISSNTINTMNISTNNLMVNENLNSSIINTEDINISNNLNCDNGKINYLSDEGIFLVNVEAQMNSAHFKDIKTNKRYAQIIDIKNPNTYIIDDETPEFLNIEITNNNSYIQFNHINNEYYNKIIMIRIKNNYNNGFFSQSNLHFTTNNCQIENINGDISSNWTLTLSNKFYFITYIFSNGRWLLWNYQTV